MQILHQHQCAADKAALQGAWCMLAKTTSIAGKWGTCTERGHWLCAQNLAGWAAQMRCAALSCCQTWSWSPRAGSRSGKTGPTFAAAARSAAVVAPSAAAAAAGLSFGAAAPSGAVVALNDAAVVPWVAAAAVVPGAAAEGPWAAVEVRGRWGPGTHKHISISRCSRGCACEPISWAGAMAWDLLRDCWPAWGSRGGWKSS